MKSLWILAAATALGVPLAAQDTLVVRADNPPIWGEAPLLVEELRIGTLEGAPERTFGAISGFLVLDDGEMWVADEIVGVVRRFARDGRYLGSVGRKGPGPGEFEGGGYPLGLARVSDGRVIAYDAVRMGGEPLSVFSTSGEFVGALSLRLASAIGVWLALRPDTAGVLYIRQTKTLTASTSLGGGRLDPGRLQGFWLRADPEGRVLDSLMIPVTDRASEGGQGYAFGFMPPYTARTVSDLSPHGYVVSGRTDRYALNRPLRDGRVVRIERSWTPVLARDEERAQFTRQLESSVKNNGRTALNTVDIPSQKPPFWAIQVDSDARIWVARHAEGYFRAETPEERAQRQAPKGLPFPTPLPLEWWEPLVTDVIEPTGRFLGTIRWPNNRSTLAATRGDTVWAVERGELDEQYLVRYHIQHR